MRYVPVLLLLIAMPVLAASVWKWRDANGVVHYSDQPVPGAELVNGLGANASSYTPVPAASAASSQSSKSSAAVTYTNVEIWKPSADATIANTGGQVSVGVRVEPALATGHRLALYLDGVLVSGFPPQDSDYDLSDVERGTHSLTLVVLDTRGKQVATSSTVQFHIRQPSVLNRP